MKIDAESIRAEWEKLSPAQREAIIQWVNEVFGSLAQALHEAMVCMGQVLELLAKEARRA